MNLSRIFLSLCMLVGFVPALSLAAPANPEPIVFTQKDGSTVTIRHYGDEHYHFTKTIDGIHVMGDGNGNYVYVDADGKPSEFIARDAEKRSSDEKNFIKSLNQSEVHEKHRALNGNRFPETLPPSVIKPHALLRANNRVKSFVKGERYFPVLLISTDDHDAFDSAVVYKKLNKKGYSEDGHVGSLRDYFIESSGGQFSPTFDVYPISLAGNFPEYKDESKFMTTALDMLVERPDFKKNAGRYESVCPFMLMHPLTNEDASAYNANYFSHQYSMRALTKKVYETGGYSFDSYAFLAQRDETSNKLNRLATFAHEFSHVLGLYDLYGVDSEGYATIGPLPFDLMALGTRNGDGRFPPTFSAFERESMGWMLLEEFFKDSLDRPYMLEPLSAMHAYSITNPNHGDEYYVIEYRPAVGFDSMISKSEYSGIKGKNGVFIWYVNYDEYEFMTNSPNRDSEHILIDVKQVLDEENTYYADFTYVNKKGKTAVTGIFDLKVYGDSLVCFLLSQDEGVPACPDVKSSSSKSSGKKSSSSKKGKSDVVPPRQFVSTQMQIRDGVLNVHISVPGVKRLKLFDALGSCLFESRFDGESAQVNVSSWAKRPVLVQVEAGGKLVSSRLVAPR